MWALTADSAEVRAWTDFADLPLVAIPQAMVCQTNVVGVGPNPAPDGIAYDAPSWGLVPAAP